MANYVQPDFRNPSIAGVTVQVEAKQNPIVPGAGPLPIFVENLTDKDDPQRTIRGPKGQYRP